ncbi:MAG: glycerophosphodiester phosphodiesterase family protein [Euryarchaeota archaeon]|nr:glycerophosphodiester phosphodiesterase family protein [Euryarchaeota archaeon]
MYFFDKLLSDQQISVQKDIWGDFVVDLLNIIGQYNNDFLISSFYEAPLALVDELSDYPVAPLLWNSIDRGLKISKRYGAKAVHAPYNMVEQTSFFGDPYYTEGPWEDTKLIETAHDQGHNVNVFTVTTSSEIEELVAAGIDGIIADYPDLLSAAELDS